MVRVIGLILVLATVAANSAHAADRLESGAGKALGTAGHHRPADARVSRVRLQIGGGAPVFVPTGRDSGRRADFLNLVGAEPGRGWRDQSLTSDSQIAYGLSEDGRISARAASQASPIRSATRSRSASTIVIRAARP
jgi:hypothetical protein